MGIELGIITTHIPHICFEDKVKEYHKPLVAAMHEAADVLASVNPDVVILSSCHWISTFHHYVNVSPRHKGILTALECPDLLRDVPYDFFGDEELAKQLVEAGQKAGLSVRPVDEPTYSWDYGAVVPLRYLLEKKNVPVIDLSLAWASNLEETRQWGNIISEVVEKSNRKAVFVASTALAHNLVRGTEKWPTVMEQALDREFCKFITEGDFATVLEMLPSYARAAGVEGGGRSLAMLLGILQGKYKGVLHGYGPSSGSGNGVVTLRPAI